MVYIIRIIILILQFISVILTTWLFGNLINPAFIYTGWVIGSLIGVLMAVYLERLKNKYYPLIEAEKLERKKREEEKKKEEQNNKLLHDAKLLEIAKFKAEKVRFMQLYNEYMSNIDRSMYSQYELHELQDKIKARVQKDLYKHNEKIIIEEYTREILDGTMIV